MTFDKQLSRYNERCPGFDVCRLVLAVLVLSVHSVLTSYGNEIHQKVWLGPLGIPLSTIMPMFFALSGFLVMGSLLRMNDLWSFIGARGLRIVPALLTEIVISAVLIGPLFTDLSLKRYVLDPTFAEYFLNIIGHVSYKLPGVFSQNPYPDVVNVSLWTIPPEITCYVYLSLMMIFRFRTTGFLVTTAALVALNVVLDLNGFVQDSVRNLVLTRHLFLAFAFGNSLYLLRTRIPYRFDLFAAATIAGLAFIKVDFLVYPALLCLSYSIAYVGCSGLKMPIDLKGDYSYGIYLYGFPVQQAFAALFPNNRSFMLSLAVCLPVTCILAVASWWLVEKRALSLRKLLPKRPNVAAMPTFAAMLLPALLITIYETEVFRSSHFLGEFNVDRKLVIVVSVAVIVVGSYLRWLYLNRTPPGSKGHSRVRGAMPAEQSIPVMEAAG